MAIAQNPPAPLGTDLTTVAQLSQPQIDQVTVFVQFWSGRLNDSSLAPDDVEAARKELVRPFNQPNAARLITPDFRGTYSRTVVPEMEKALRGSDIYRSINAALVLGQVGTDKSANLLLVHCDLQNQPAFQVRMTAANAMRILLQGGTLEPRKVSDASRRLRDAATRETDGLVLRHLFAALNAADASTLPADERSKVRAALNDALADAARRLASSKDLAGSGPVVIAVAAAVGKLRERITEYSTENQREMGEKLLPALGQLLGWVSDQWDSAHADATLNSQMRVLVAASEGLMQFIDPQVRGQSQIRPNSDLRTAWTSGDKARFQTDVQAWRDVLSKPPYQP